MPKVSVILPFYNRAATLPRCIDSVRAQTFTDWEMVAVDDCSRDDSVAVIERYGDPRIRVLRHEQNRGAGPARDTAMANARGEWFALIDSDDEWLPGKLAAQMAALERDGRSQLCVCAFHFIRDGKTELKPKPFQDSFERALHRECSFNFGTILVIHRELALSLGGFDPELPRHEDWEWMLRAALRGHSPVFVEEPLARVHCVDQPRLEQFVPSTERFLAKYDATFRKGGEDYRRQVLAYHYESVASMSYEQRRYALGHRYLLRSFATWPWRNPLALAALPLSVFDWALGTRIIQWGAQLRRTLFENDRPVVS
jgi:glycosyltransferase involved in cell wall biosynthesis